MSRERQIRSPGLQAMYDKYIRDDPEAAAHYERAKADAEIAQSIYDLRTGAGLSQRELAQKIGTTASAISRLEDADYSGHSMAMLRRVAEALGRRVEVRFPAIDPSSKKSAARVSAKKATGPDDESVSHHKGQPKELPKGKAKAGKITGATKAKKPSKT